MIASSKQDPGSAWLGGEAHVRRQESGRLWRLPPEWRQVLWLSGALLLGSAIGGGATAAVSRHAKSPTPLQKRKGEFQMNAEQSRRRAKRSASPLSVAFTIGAAVGAGVALYMAPHSGSEMRRRITSGAKTAQEELSEVVEETRGAIEALAKDARQTLRQTAWRLTEVVTATKDAFQAEADAPERMPADE